VTNHVWAMRPAAGTLNDSVRIGAVTNVVSFDRDSRGRVLATSMGTGSSPANNTGIVYILESPDMVAAPVSLRRGQRAATPAIRMSDVRRHPGDYVVRGMDGREFDARKAASIPAGVFLVTKRGESNVTRFMALP
jgi:hypothetical protein